MAPDPKQPLARVPSKDVGPITYRGVPIDIDGMGDGIAMLDDFLKKRFGNRMPNGGFLNQAWGIYELIGFLKSGGRENRGDVAAMLAEFVAERGRQKIAEGATLAGARYAGYVVAEGIVVIWTTYEAFKLGVYLREIWDEDERREEMYRKWELDVNQHFWSLDDLSTAFQGFRESAFDQIAGDVASHGIVPSLTVEAAKELQRLKNETSRRWLDGLQRLRDAEQPKTFTTASGVSFTFPPDKYEIAKAAQALEVELASGMKSVIEYQANPANWNLTNEQKAVLPETWQQLFAERDALKTWSQSHSMPYPDPTSAGHMIKTSEERDEALSRLKEHMGAEAENPSVPVDQVVKEHSPVYGPQPRPRG